jgi:hypothetical protein
LRRERREHHQPDRDKTDPGGECLRSTVRVQRRSGEVGEANGVRAGAILADEPLRQYGDSVIF